MTAETIVQRWLDGHSREWLIKEEEKSLKYQVKTREDKKNIAWQAKHNVEEALLGWWRKQGG